MHNAFFSAKGIQRSSRQSIIFVANTPRSILSGAALSNFYRLPFQFGERVNRAQIDICEKKKGFAGRVILCSPFWKYIFFKPVMLCIRSIVRFVCLILTKSPFYPNMKFRIECQISLACNASKFWNRKFFFFLNININKSVRMISVKITLEELLSHPVANRVTLFPLFSTHSFACDSFARRIFKRNMKRIFIPLNKNS